MSEYKTGRTAAQDEAAAEDVKRWAAVDAFALERLHPSGSHLHEQVEYATKLSQEKGLRNIEVSPLQGKFLMAQCQMIDAKNVLEVGTLGGVSSIWMASAGPDVKVTTIELIAEHKAVADEAIAHAGLGDRIEVILGAGVDVLPKIRQQVESGERPKFDLVFIDADKQNNLHYYNEAILMCRSRACIIVDNVVRRGMVADFEAAEKDERVMGARKVIAAVGTDGRLLGATVMQTVGEKHYDGFLMCVVK